MSSNINADNGVSSGVAGLKYSADTSGVLVLQTNTTNALTLDTNQNATFATGILATNPFTGTYTDGTIVDYITGVGRINVGPSDDIAFYHNGIGSRTEIARFTYTGNMGLGTAAPRNVANYHGLTIDATTGSFVDFNGAGTRIFTLYAYGTTVGFQAAIAADMAFSSNGTETMRLTSAGTLLVGKSSGGLTAQGIQLVPSGQSAITAPTGVVPFYINNLGSGAQAFIEFRTGAAATTVPGTINTDGTNLLINGNSNLIFGTNTATERMRIDSAGNVGIGTSSPSYKLQINASGFGFQHISNTGTNSLRTYCGSDYQIIETTSVTGTNQFGYDPSGNFYIQTNTSNTRLQIDTSGNLKLATASTSILNSSGRPMLKQTGGILQVVSTNLTGQVTTGISGGNPGTFSAISGFSVSITPSSTSSKILIMIQGCGSETGYSSLFHLQLRRSGTIVGASSGSGYNTASVGEQRASADANSQNNFSWHYVDSPATTSAITYQVYVTAENNQNFILNNSGNQNASQVYSALSASNITAMEIAG